MTLDIVCPSCGRTLRVGAEHAGKQIRCPACQQISVTPGGAAKTVATAVAPTPAHGSPATSWHVRTPEGAVYGPIVWNEVLAWVAEGRIADDCELGNSDQGPWQSATNLIPNLRRPLEKPHTPAPPTTYPWSGEIAPPPAPIPHSPLPTPHSPPLAPHRAALILVMGLLGFLVGCPIFSVIAWVMGSHDLAAMRSGRMDRGGEGVTLAGMVLGIIVSVFWLLAAFILLAIALIAVASQF